MKSIVILTLVLILQGFTFTRQNPENDGILSKEEQKLYELIMEYRKSKGLPPIALSAKLTKVAQAHARDLADNYKFDFDNKCNPHSWSKKGKWSPCCYTNDHKEAKCMWDKPREIADYAANGYEIAYYSSKGATAEEGLAGWKVSPGHNPLIVNEGMWSQVKWKGIGIGLYGEYGIVWFGEVEDDAKPAPTPKPASTKKRAL
jgi:uncharacterized protein YkwD